jgi:hypothetical protein
LKTITIVHFSRKDKKCIFIKHLICILQSYYSVYLSSVPLCLFKGL